MPVYLGNTQVQKYLGGIEIKNIYLGTVLIYAIATTSVQLLTLLKLELQTMEELLRNNVYLIY
jgi:hypothetical protein